MLLIGVGRRMDPFLSSRAEALLRCNGTRLTFQSASFFFPIKIFSSKVALGSFFRAAVPDDITQRSPNHLLWGAPSATLANTSCNIEQYFVDPSIVFGKCLCIIYFFRTN